MSDPASLDLSLRPVHETIVRVHSAQLPTLVNTIRDRASLKVAVVAVAGKHVHVEPLEPVLGMTWSAPDIEVPGHAPWYELGWYSAVCSTIERTLRNHGIECSGSFEQRKHWSISAILKVSTTAGELWFKQVPDFMAHEGRVHGDLHAGNWTRHTDGRWMIFDWTDACVAHPFVDLGVLPSKEEPLREARLRSYLDAWGLDNEDERLVPDALAIAGAHHAISYQRIVDGVGGDDGPSWHPAIRSFLDRMLRSLAD